jgi:sulfur-carrier protein
MAHVTFAQVLQRHVVCPPVVAPGETLRAVLDHVFAGNPPLRGYVLDDQAALRKHMLIFIDGRLISDRKMLSDAVTETSRIHVIQSLSGG